MVMCIAALTMQAQTTPQYVDLGLPSGTKWKTTNEAGFYNWDSATSKFGDKLPEQWQLMELEKYCKWTWTGKGYTVTGKNGKSIFLPAAGERYNGKVRFAISCGYYWSSTPKRSEYGKLLSFKSDYVFYSYQGRSAEYSVRLVQKPTEVEKGYVDLDLPSGTLWKTTNEEGVYYRWRSAWRNEINKFGDRLPQKWQWEELKENCTWTWTGKGYRVTGKNGKSIFLPADGYRSCYDDDGSKIGKDVGSRGCYWTSESTSGEMADCLYFNSDKWYLWIDYVCYGMSVRLVKEYVDLGLPSGTKWKFINEWGGDLTDWEFAMKQFGDKLPTKEQWKELEDCCAWILTDKGYKVIGKNGLSIFLPADGFLDNNFHEIDKNEAGNYWSSTPESSVFAWSLNFYKNNVDMRDQFRTSMLSVRLVQE